MKKISNARFELLFSMYGTDGLIQEENVYSISEAIKIIKHLIKNKKNKQHENPKVSNRSSCFGN